MTKKEIRDWASGSIDHLNNIKQCITEDNPKFQYIGVACNTVRNAVNSIAFYAIQLKKINKKLKKENKELKEELNKCIRRIMEFRNLIENMSKYKISGGDETAKKILQEDDLSRIKDENEKLKQRNYELIDKVKDLEYENNLLKQSVNVVDRLNLAKIEEECRTNNPLIGKET